MKIYDLFRENSPKLAVLIDPDKACETHLGTLAGYAAKGMIDFFFVGGSITYSPVKPVVKFLKDKTDIPVILFPGDEQQVCTSADAILFLSLISGRNPEYLIGKHVQSAMKVKASGLEVIPTGYILVEGNKISTTQYITQTFPIPSGNTQLAVATAVAGELLGMKAIYLEAGSNAKEAVRAEIISAVRKNTDIPLIVGGGIKSASAAQEAINAGAGIIVIGTAVEQNPHVIAEISEVFNR